MKRIIISWLLILSFSLAAQDPACSFFQKEVYAFKDSLPSKLKAYSDFFKDCGITHINNIILSDYFNLEKDAMLGYSYIYSDLNVMNNELLSYYLENDRMDLLLNFFDSFEEYPIEEKLNVFEFFFYKDPPFFLEIELMYRFNNFTESERLQVAQDLIPNNKKELLSFNKKRSYLFKYWPMFDQMAFIIHLRENYPDLFDKFEEFWRKLLVENYFEYAPQTDPSFQVLNKILIRKGYSGNSEQLMYDLKVIMSGFNDLENKERANKSLVFYYLIKTNQFDQATEFLARFPKEIYFNTLRYYSFLSDDQKKYLTSINIQFTIDEVIRLFTDYFYQIDDSLLQAWIWDLAIDNKIDLSEYLDDYAKYMKKFPRSNEFLKELDPKAFYVWNNLDREPDIINFNNPMTEFPLGGEYSRDTLLRQVWYFNYYSKMPLTDRRSFVTQILPYIDIDDHYQFNDILPYLSINESFDIVTDFEYLEKVPTHNRYEWYDWVSKQLFGKENKVIELQAIDSE